MFKVTVVPLYEMPSWYQLVLGISMGVGVLLMVASFFVAARELKQTNTDKAGMAVLSVGLALMVIPVTILALTGLVVPTIFG